MTVLDMQRRLPLPSRPARGRGRPVGAVGEVARALLDEAAAAPGTARELSRRACVGDRVGMYTVSRLKSAGLLVMVLDSRPAVFAAKGCPELCLLADRAADAGAGLGAFAALLAVPFMGGLSPAE
ncbi:hypothetical protein [Roseateles asaccharophilus]|uniref:Uncharacterized protein n=1 Tax=Roseateles asaccharophilus TaxID=582607 RepID=A0ABU2A3H7_9BURK|nr:hypothetical protein [Roseateles asaccharophilus]MDR7331747.1 hypothetical protein [Roseateles asaccharophilus]